MSLSVLIFLWLVSFGFLFALSQERIGNQKWLFRRTFDEYHKLQVGQTPLFARLGRVIKNPGWLVSSLSNNKFIASQLIKANHPLTIQEVLGYKQLIWTVFLWGTILYLWFWGIEVSVLVKIIIGFVFAFWIIDLWIHDQIQQFKKKLQQDIPYFLDLVSLVLETGKGAEQSLEFVCRKQSNTLSECIKKELQLMQIGKNFDEVLYSLKSIIQSESFDGFVMSVLQSKKLGVSLSETLKLQSELINTKKRQRGEELSRTASVKISLPLVLFIFPALLLLYLGPGILQLMG